MIPILHAVNLPKVKNEAFLLQDRFHAALAAGAVNGTLSTDGSVRTIVDSTSKLSIADGFLKTNLGVGNGDPRITYPSQAKVRGKTLLSAHQTSGLSAWYIGWDINTTGMNSFGLVTNVTTLVINRNDGSTISGSGTYAANKVIYFATVLRPTGTLSFAKGGGLFQDWTLVYVNYVSAGATVYPAAVNGSTTLVSKTRFIRIPSRLFLFDPKLSDSFTRANGALGNSDNVGTESGETATLGATAWSVPVGTVTISSNRAASSALSGGKAYAALQCDCPDAYVETKLTRTAGSAGILLRYVDDNNYIQVVHNGTNVVVTEVISGTPSTLLTTAATYAADALITAQCRGTSIRVIYNLTTIGTASVTNITGSKFGIYSETTTAIFNTFSAWATGTNGEYSSLNLGI